MSKKKAALTSGLSGHIVVPKTYVQVADLTPEGLRERVAEIIGAWWLAQTPYSRAGINISALTQAVEDAVVTLVAEARRDASAWACPLCHCCGERRHDGGEPCVSCETARREQRERDAATIAKGCGRKATCSLPIATKRCAFCRIAGAIRAQGETP